MPQADSWAGREETGRQKKMSFQIFFLLLSTTASWEENGEIATAPQFPVILLPIHFYRGSLSLAYSSHCVLGQHPGSCETEEVFCSSLQLIHME